MFLLKKSSKHSSSNPNRCMTKTLPPARQWGHMVPACGYGTALGVIRAAVERGHKLHVYADETRPFLQGARLTAWELMHDGIPTTVLCDNMVASLMRAGKIQAVVVGADRIAAN